MNYVLMMNGWKLIRLTKINEGANPSFFYANLGIFKLMGYYINEEKNQYLVQTLVIATVRSN